MIPIPYLQEALGGALVLSLVFGGVQTVKLKILDAELDAAVAQTEVCYQNVEKQRSTVVDLREQITKQNAQILEQHVIGMKNQALQKRNEELAERLDTQKRLTDEIQRKYDEMPQLTPCETCDSVLRSIAGVGP